MVLTCNVDIDRVYQTMDGFGIGQGFGRARVLAGALGLAPERTREVLDLLFGAEGAAFSILRLCIGASSSDGPGRMGSIAPVDPGGPDRPLNYVWDGDDCGQVWLAKEATRYGVRRIFAHPLSAPAYMLHSQTATGDGIVQGMPGTAAAAGDWRPAFAEYLLQYTRFYADSGVQITDLGFANEPDLLIHHPDHVAKYPLMRLEPHHVVDFVKVLGRAIEQSGMQMRMVCCNAVSWNYQAVYTAAVEADEKAAGYVGIHGGNNYRTRARTPLPTTRPTWMTEWDPGLDGHEGPDDWDSGDRCDGIRLAEDVHDAITLANVSGYLYLFGASARAGTRALIRLDGADYQISPRFWALAAFSRFIGPGARRLHVSMDPPEEALKVSAFLTPAGDVVATLLNLRECATEVTLNLTSGPRTPRIRRWLTDTGHAMAVVAPRPPGDAMVLSPRSLTTVVCPGCR